jgi:diacylglycerol kinase
MKTERDRLSVIKSLSNAIAGLGVYAARSRRNLIVESIVGLLVLIGAWALHFDAVRTGLVVLSITLVLSLEILNTAIEIVLNTVHPDYSPAVKMIKDLAGGAVLVAAIGAVALGLVLFWEPLGLPGGPLVQPVVLGAVMLSLLVLLCWSFLRRA